MVKNQLQKLENNIWFLNLHIIYHLYNNQELFNNIKIKNIYFVIARKHIILTKKIGNIFILFASNNVIKLYNITLNLRCNSNLIILTKF